MGTNYYLKRRKKPHCSTCKCYERLHIGKASVGWPFILRIHPELGINEWLDWKRLLASEDTYVVDEYGSEVEKAELEKRVLKQVDPPEARLHSPGKHGPYKVNPSEFS